MNKVTPTISVILLLLFCASCANYKIHLSSDQAEWKKNVLDPTLKLQHTLFLIGDAGGSPRDGKSLALLGLEKEMAKVGENSSVIFLGDNIYPHAMPPKGEKADRQLAEHRLNAQLDILKNFKGTPYFIPGNHDWMYYGLKGVKRQEKYVEKKLNAGIEDEDDWENYFLPDNGCSGPEVIEVNDQLVYIIIDSQWWLRDWDKDPAINDGCESKSRDGFAYVFDNIIKKHKNKNVVVAMHHPFYSYGPHGGKMSAKAHLFPLTDWKDNLYVPLPVLGSLVQYGRGAIGISQDLAHSKYKDLKESLLTYANKHGSFIFASGHEHTLQYIKDDFHQYIVSGAGSKKNPTALGKGAEFTYGSQGFAKLDFYEGGEGWLTFYATPEDGSDPTIVFRKKIKDKLSISEDNIPTSFPEYEQRLDSVTTKLLSYDVTKKGGLHNFVFGKHYRDIYVEKYKVPVLDLATFMGGVTTGKRGGGNQTNSLRLIDKDGREWVMRDMTKDASRVIPYPFNKMSLADFVVEDNFLSSHPFASLAVPQMSDAVKVYHANPSIYYIPKQPVLGVHNDLFGGAVYLIEERVAGNWENQPTLGNATKIISTGDMMDKVRKNHNHKVDQKWTIRSRIFDSVLGDWDRHDDQWRWALVGEEDGVKQYRGVPRDRDQAFSENDGMVAGIARLVTPFFRQLVPFEGEVKKAKWLVWSSRHLENSFINELTWEDWKAEAEFIQKNLTDEVIENSFKNWFPKAQELSADHIIAALKQRRDDIVRLTRQHYEFTSEKVDVIGTDKRDRFEIERLENGNVRVKVFELSNKKGNKKRQVYEREFEHGVTKEINVYGLDEKDEFYVTGTAPKSIKVRLIGGLNNDFFKDESKVSGVSKKTLVVDNKKKNTLELGTEGKDKTTENRERNIYDRRHIHYEYDFVIPLISITGNPDDGVLIGPNISLTRYSWKRRPYGSTHLFGGNYSTATNSFDFYYNGELVERIGRWDMLFDLEYHGERYAINFFDFGNETKRTNTDDLDFNRVRQSFLGGEVALSMRFADEIGRFYFGPMAKHTKIENTTGRFIEQYSETNPEVLESRYFAGAKMGLEFENLDNLLNPHHGFRWLTSFSWEKDLQTDNFDFFALRTELSLFYSLDKNENAVLTTRLGYESNFGEFEFWQAPNLGGDTNLRGFRAERFYGKSSFYQNTDLRIKLFTSVNKILPVTLGIYGGFDYGKVMLEDISSEKWHTGYGGGIWLSPVDLVMITAGYFVSDEDQRFAVRGGFFF